MKDDLRLTRHPRYEGNIMPIEKPSDIPERWRNTPIEELILSQNFEKEIIPQESPQLSVATCIEFRYQPRLPSSFAYILRRAGGHLIGSEFSLTYTLAKGVRHLALVGHNDCGMTKVADHKQKMIDTLIEQGWYKDRAEDYISIYASRYAIPDELDTLQREYLRLRRLFKKLEIAPLFISLAKSKFYLPTWYFRMLINGDVDKAVGSESPVRDEDILPLI
ncbi:MAG: hypothetical protein K2X27_24020 [Candidatus Obscuribacterales bacterium]|nr:hypothetical protein [Candidatus Obscuribacterales bacterium]